MLPHPARIGSLRSLLFFLVALAASRTGAAGEPISLDAAEAAALVNEALNAQRKIPAYTTTSYLIRGSDICTIRSYVANGPGRLRQKRTEVTMTVATKPVETTTFISNVQGLWKLVAGKSVLVEREPALLRPIPRRLATAELLGLPGDTPVQTLEENVTYFGMPAKKITISLSAPLLERLARETELMKAALRKASEGRVDEETFEKTWQGRAKSQFPAAYVYFIHAQSPFVLAWQAYSLNGELVSEIAHQEFKVMNGFPASLFDPPAIPDASDTPAAKPAELTQNRAQ